MVLRSPSSSVRTLSTHLTFGKDHYAIPINLLTYSDDTILPTHSFIESCTWMMMISFHTNTSLVLPPLVGTAQHLLLRMMKRGGRVLSCQLSLDTLALRLRCLLALRSHPLILNAICYVGGVGRCGRGDRYGGLILTVNLTRLSSSSDRPVLLPSPLLSGGFFCVRSSTRRFRGRSPPSTPALCHGGGFLCSIEILMSFAFPVFFEVHTAVDIVFHRILGWPSWLLGADRLRGLGFGRKESCASGDACR